MIKCKKITQSILATELYGMAYRFDIRTVIKAILKKILESVILLILYIYSKFLDDCLIKLGTIQEKRLIVDIISLYPLYKLYKITKVK